VVLAKGARGSLSSSFGDRPFVHSLVSLNANGTGRILRFGDFRDMLSDQNDMVIVESVIYMANRFQRPMLAEGVETLAHAKALMALGCGLAQGYGIARPMPPEAMPDWLAHWPERQDWRGLATLQ